MNIVISEHQYRLLIGEGDISEISKIKEIIVRLFNEFGLVYINGIDLDNSGNVFNLAKSITDKGGYVRGNIWC